jgi:hypothetical protein
MSDPTTAREALVIEAIGDASTLLETMERLTPQLHEAAREVSQANAGLLNALAAFEAQVMAIADKAKVQTVKHILLRTDEAARRSIEQHSRAMADAARVALGAELGATLQRLQAGCQAPVKRAPPRWEAWLTHAAAAVASSALTWAAAIWLCAG